MSNTKERERQFHNKRYIDDKRKVLSGVYTFAQSSKSLFSKMLTNIGSGDKVLEIGCGVSSINKSIVDMGAVVTVIDLSEQAILINKRNTPNDVNNINYLVMDAENLEFDDDSFDLIYGSGILHHLRIEKAIVEINRVLKKGGKALFYEPLGHNVFINIFRFITPSFRSEDEHPLLKEDLILIKNKFPKTRFHYFYLLSLILVPFNKIKILMRLVNLIERVDKSLNKLFPFLNKYNWITVIEIKK